MPSSGGLRHVIRANNVPEPSTRRNGSSGPASARADQHTNHPESPAHSQVPIEPYPHVAHDLLAYAGQLAVRPDSAYLPFDLVVRDDASPRDLLRTVTGAGRLLSTMLAASDPSVRAWHWGPTDASGFAALGVNETLVHTYDIAEGLGIHWHPPRSLCTAVLTRLVPHAPAGNPVQVLLWSTGRTDLPGRPRPTSWVLEAAIE
ncbi:maleylpyruvate isomerase N-terminal domain-containing protein [Micromonospora sp. LOL_014]|uniref:maleylpyruvate isomerase N-terminal domain-containing protein n=1 Tax=Micromonospora sp. LOL_014 TaxID=3345415 RepID=UPI003A88CE76